MSLLLRKLHDGLAHLIHLTVDGDEVLVEDMLAYLL